MQITQQTLSFRKIVLLRFCCETLLVLLLQYIACQSSNFFSSSSPLWLVSGTALAFIFLRGYASLPGIFLGTSLALSFPVGGIFTLQTCVIFFLSQAFISPSLVFYHKRTFIKFVLLLLIICFAANAVLVYFHYLKDSLTNVMANFNGCLIIAVTFVNLDAFFADLQDNISLRLYLTFGVFISAFISYLITLLGFHPLGLNLAILTNLLSLAAAAGIFFSIETIA